MLPLAKSTRLTASFLSEWQGQVVSEGGRHLRCAEFEPTADQSRHSPACVAQFFQQSGGKRCCMACLEYEMYNCLCLTNLFLWPPHLCLRATLPFSLVLPPLCVLPLQYPDLLLERVICHAQNAVDLHRPDLCRIAVGCCAWVIGTTAPSVTKLVALVANHLSPVNVTTRLG
jgi:hypothetical protein